MGLNLKEVLDKERLNRLNSEKIDRLLEESFQQENLLTEEIKQRNLIESNEGEGLKPEHIYSLEEIKKVCVDYRLRFLDAKLFKGEIPLEVLLNMSKLESQTKVPFKAFKIVAPAEL